jgi:hypothetical protein
MVNNCYSVPENTSLFPTFGVEQGSIVKRQTESTMLVEKMTPYFSIIFTFEKCTI